MSGNFGSSSSIQPLSIGNVVSAGVRLYRSHLKTYLKLALIAHLWALVPIWTHITFSFWRIDLPAGKC